MKLKNSVSILFFAFCVVSFAFASSAFADNLGQGSTQTDCLQIGKITKVGNREFTLQTEFEKEARTYSYAMHPDAYVLTADRGVFLHFADMKPGQLVASYGWVKDGKLICRRLVVLDPNDYLVKRLAEDAKAGVFYKSER